MHQSPSQSARIGGIFFAASRTFIASVWCSHASGSLGPLLLGLSAARPRFDSLIPSRMAYLITRYSTHMTIANPITSKIRTFTIAMLSSISSCLKSSTVPPWVDEPVSLSPSTSVNAGDLAVAARPPVRSRGTSYCARKQSGYSEVVFQIQLVCVLVIIWALGELFV